MEPTAALRSRLRRKLGEVTPEGGTEDETMFTDQAIDDLLTESTSFDQAVLSGWEDKLSEWASLVDVTDGAASRRLSDLMENAETVIKYYRGKVIAGPNDTLARSRTRVGKIVRHG